MSDAFIPRAQEAVGIAQALLQDALIAVRKRVAIDGGDTMSRVFDREQRATHGLAWLATYVEALRQIVAYAERMQGEGKYGEIEDLQVRIGFGEYLAADFRRHSDELGRDGAAVRSRIVGARRSRRG